MSAKRMQCSAIIVGAVLIGIFLGAETTPNRAFGGKKPSQPLLPIVAHRGLLRHAPENTIAAFGACCDLRIGFELDLRRSKDGRLICIHDSTLDRTTDGKGEVRSLNLIQLQMLDAGRWFHTDFAGQRIPTLSEVLDLLKNRKAQSILIAVDVKAADKNVEADAIRLAQKYGVLDQLLFIGRTIVESDVRTRLRTAAPGAHVAVLSQTAEDLGNAMKEKNADWIYVRFVPTAAQVQTIHQAGKRVFIAGPKVSGDESANWRSALSAKVDAILTDYPLHLRKVMQKK